MTNIIEAKVLIPVSTKKTITLSNEVMEALGIHPMDKVLIHILGGHVSLQAASGVNLMDDIPLDTLERSDNLELPNEYKLEYQTG